MTDIRLAFDAGNHYYEAEDAFTRYIEPEFKRRCMQWADVNGKKMLLVGGKINRFIPNPTFDMLSAPGSLEEYFRGNNPKGMIYYGPHGEMSVQIAPDVERKKAGAVMTPDEAKVAIADYIAYFGTYTIDEKAGTVIHHRQASVQPGDAGDFIRKFEFVGDRLILRPPNSKQEITWERIK